MLEALTGRLSARLILFGGLTSFLAAAPAPAPGENHRAAPLRQAAVHAAPATAAATTPPPGLRLRKPEAAPAARPAAAAPAAAPVFAVRSVLALDAPLTAGGYAWNEDGAPAGPTTIVADIKAHVIYVYRGGVEIGRSSLIKGDWDKPTPTGIFPILQKKRHHISNLYNAPMPFMLRLTWDGVAIHASLVDDDYATHGCIGIPDEFAELLFAKAGLGDQVMVTRDWSPTGPARAA